MIIKYRKLDNHYETYEVSMASDENSEVKLVGKVFSDLKGKWNIVAYFDTLLAGSPYLKKQYDEMTEAGRVLVSEWQYHQYMNENETEEIYIGDLFT